MLIYIEKNVILLISVPLIYIVDFNNIWNLELKCNYILMFISELSLHERNFDLFIQLNKYVSIYCIT